MDRSQSGRFRELDVLRGLGDFLFSRFSRLYPTYWAALAILLVWNLLDPVREVWWPGFIVNVTMLQKFVGYPDVDNVYWTLATELCFYVLMTGVYFFRQMERIVLVGLAWLLAGIAWGSVHHWTGSDERSIGNTYLILPYAPYFVAGMMFYLIYSRGLRYTYVGLIVLGLGVVLLIHGSKVAGVSLGIFAIFALAVLGGLKWLINPVTLWLGAISYPLYLVHRLPGYAFLEWMNARHMPHLVGFTIAVAGSLAAAHLLSIAVERPAMRALRTRYRKRRAPPHTDRPA
jgi:peptidoglycan/LPS O-acetylase OafA/YrhL